MTEIDRYQNQQIQKPNPSQNNGNAIAAVGFARENQENGIREKGDTNKDGVLTSDELTQLKFNLGASRNRLNQGTGKISDYQTKAGSTVINTQDPSNRIRLEAAGLLASQMDNPDNVFVNLGEKDGRTTYGYYSKGFGPNDERTGVIDINKDNKIEGSLGLGWRKPSPEQSQALKKAFTHLQDDIKTRFNGSNDEFRQYQKKVSEIDDLLARQDIQNDPSLQSALLYEKHKLDFSKSEQAWQNANAQNYQDVTHINQDKLLETHILEADERIDSKPNTREELNQA
ncbi:MAG: hypothetical protein RLZZ361_566, partial [Cyanobacteriota bacterium]